MEKNTIYEITTPNGVRINAVCVSVYTTQVDTNKRTEIAICYSQNRLFEYITDLHYLFVDEYNGYQWCVVNDRTINILSDYCTIPELDEILENTTKSVSL